MLGLEPVIHAYVAWAVKKSGRLELSTIQAIWPISVGRVWAQHTQPKRLSGGRLDVAVVDSVWLNELRFQSERILKRLNRLFPDGVKPIRSLRLTLGNVEPQRAGRGEMKVDPNIRVPLTEEQRAGIARISDPKLREVVCRVIERDVGRLSNESESGEVHEEGRE